MKNDPNHSSYEIRISKYLTSFIFQFLKNFSYFILLDNYTKFHNLSWKNFFSLQNHIDLKSFHNIL